MTIKARAGTLSKHALVRLVSSLYGIDEHVDDIIDRHLASEGENDDANSLVAILTHQMEHLREEDDFVSYRSSHGFASQLASILTDINNLLRKQDLAQALRLTEDFLCLSNHSLERADDSDGYLGDVFREAVDQWLNIAAELRAVQPGAENWVEKVLHFFNQNDYGCFDNVIAHSRNLLTEQELRQLASRFEKDAEQALSKPEGQGSYSFDASHASLGLQGVAEALQDIALYEKSKLLTSPQLNPMQIASIVRFAFEVSDLERAAHWLEQPQWQEDMARYRPLRHELLRRQGNMEQLKIELRDNFLKHPHVYTLEPYWLVANEEEQREIRARIEALDNQALDMEDQIAMLLFTGSIEHAAKAILRKEPAELANLYYATLLNWVSAFEAAQQTLAAIICYRALLTDLLDRGYSRAYHHGARYFHKLLALDRRLDDYQGFEDAQAFIRRLQTKHWRKRSFWDEAGYPNKPDTQT